jgi:glycosyltransferase involved in cell wall biosynthesis
VSGNLHRPAITPGLNDLLTHRHIITPEYPPQPGGVSDYAEQLARSLALAGEEVHVWCPGAARAAAASESVHVHRELGTFSPRDLRRVGEQLDQFPAPRRILVQWVPHGYGYRSLNVRFCLWLWNRARRRGDRVEIMVHEAFLAFGESRRQDAAALIHRLMTVILLQAAERVWVSIPACERLWRPYALGREVAFQWTPIPSNIPVVRDTAGAQAVRHSFAPNGELLVGHFGTYGAPVASVLEPILLQIARDTPSRLVLLLMGINSEQFRTRLIEKHPALVGTLQATGPLQPEDLSRYITACDFLIQPYPDGASSRRTSLMAGLAHGKPVVTTAGPGTEPVWEDSRAVRLAPAGDAASFAREFAELSADPSARARMGQAAAQLYRDQFDITHTVAALRDSRIEDPVCAS